MQHGGLIRGRASVFALLAAILCVSFGVSDYLSRSSGGNWHARGASSVGRSRMRNVAHSVLERMVDFQEPAVTAPLPSQPPANARVGETAGPPSIVALAVSSGGIVGSHGFAHRRDVIIKDDWQSDSAEPDLSWEDDEDEGDDESDAADAGSILAQWQEMILDAAIPVDAG